MFQDFVTVFPPKMFKATLSPSTFQTFIGVAETILGLGITLGNHHVCKICCLGCILITILACYMFFKLKQYGSMLFPVALLISLNIIYNN